MSRGDDRRGAPNLAWNLSGAHLLFHYTTAEQAEQIGAERVYRVSDQQHQTEGPGLFLTNVRPGGLSDDELCKRLFAFRRPHVHVQGVVVIRPNEVLLPRRQFGQGKWIHPAPRGSDIDLTVMLVGYGRRNPHDGQWIFSQGCYEAT